jgi:hypothetical protein
VVRVERKRNYRRIRIASRGEITRQISPRPQLIDPVLGTAAISPSAEIANDHICWPRIAANSCQTAPELRCDTHRRFGIFISESRKNYVRASRIEAHLM